jgi:pimeloyl-ACP methyl ester carboxylesterase
LSFHCTPRTELTEPEIQELYEPFWDDLLLTLSTLTKPINIRSIWIMTPPHFSASRNPSYHNGSLPPDTARDILYLTNHFSSQILHPIFGIGHSIGASQLVSLSLMHPSLFTGLACIEPIIASEANVPSIGREKLAMMALKRKREWKSREAAEAYFARAWDGWDERVRERWNGCALVDVGSRTGEGKGAGEVQLAWGRAQEVAVFMDMSELRDSAVNGGTVGETGKGSATWTQYPQRTWEGLRDLVVPVLFVCGEESTSSTAGCKEYWKEDTGTNMRFWARGHERRVELIEMRGVGHLMPLERPRKCAAVVGGWVEKEMGKWWEEWERQRKWREMGKQEKETVVETWTAGLKSRI